MFSPAPKVTVGVCRPTVQELYNTLTEAGIAGEVNRFESLLTET